jgi:hypothetical protein
MRQTLAQDALEIPTLMFEQEGSDALYPGARKVHKGKVLCARDMGAECDARPLDAKRVRVVAARSVLSAAEGSDALSLAVLRAPGLSLEGHRGKVVSASDMAGVRDVIIHCV